MKKIVLASLMMVCLPYLAMSQSVDDDLYFIPKKKAEKKEEVKQEVKVVVVILHVIIISQWRMIPCILRRNL